MVGLSTTIVEVSRIKAGPVRPTVPHQSDCLHLLDLQEKERLKRDVRETPPHFCA